MKFLAIPLLLLTLASSACAQTPARFDTRALSAFGFDTAAAKAIDSIARAHAPNEVGMCLRGTIDGERLQVHSVVAGVTHFADSARVSYTCDAEAPDFVGVAHTHPGATSICMPSDEDFVVLMDDDAPKVLISLIRCLTMTTSMPNAYAQLRDVRWAWLVWPTFID